jgi:cbb3-type cytochrome oxidase subunit 3
MLSQLAADYFARSPVLAFPIVALALFMVVFVAVSVRALCRQRAELDQLAALPLADSQEVKRHG